VAATKYASSVLDTGERGRSYNKTGIKYTDPQSDIKESLDRAVIISYILGFDANEI